MGYCYPPQGSGGGGGAGTMALDDLTDVIIVAPVSGQVLGFNGLDWVNSAAAVVGAGAGVLFFLDSTKIVPAGVGPQTKSMETLLRTPSSAAEVDEAQIVNNNTVLIDQYMYNTALGLTSIDGGEWDFDTYTYVSNAANVSELIVSVNRVFVGAGTITITGVGVNRTATITGGTPFIASDFNADITMCSSIITPNAVLVVNGFTSDSVVSVTCLGTYTNEAGIAYSVSRYLFQASTGEINALSATLFSVLTVQPAFPTNITDKLLTKYFARTNNVGNITVHLVHNGTDHYTHFHTPLQTKHNDLAGLQGGVVNQYFHLTTAEYTGTGTGTFVRQNSPTLTGIPILSTATATSINKVVLTQPITVATLTIADSKTLSVLDDTTISGASTTVVSETAFGQAATQGIATTFSRGDHTHGTPVAPSANIVSDANRNTKGGTDALLSNIAGTDNSAFGFNTLMLTTGAGFNTGFGSFALDAVTTGVNNTAIGFNAGSAIATTNDTTCIGYNAGAVNTAADNTFVGSGAGSANITSTQNTAVGKGALGSGDIVGARNTAVGYNAGFVLTASGGIGNNTLIGADCGDAALNISYCTAVGSGALGAATNNGRLTAIGYRALASITGITADVTAVGYQAGLVNTAADNTFIGSSCGDANTSGTRNTALGKDALGANTTSSDCTMIGYNAGLLNTAAENTFVGSLCGDANTSGTRNTAVGKDALGANTTTNDCTMVGYRAGFVNTTEGITAIGSGALDAAISAIEQTAVGSNALGSMVSGQGSTAIGYSAGASFTGHQGTFVGSNAGRDCTIGTANTFIGYYCGKTVSTGIRNTMVGAFCEFNGGTTTVGDCVFVGYNTGYANTAADNTFIGSFCGDANTSGTRNTALGKDALGANTTTNDCTMVGYRAGLLSTAANNTLVGSSAGDAITTGANNTALGKDALGANATSADSTALGYQAGLTNTGANNVFIGSGADGSAAARANAIGIGKGVSVVADSTWVVGTIGIKQAIVEGANAAMGVATLVAGTIVVANTLVTANSRIFLTSNDPNGGTQGAVFVSARTAGVDFTITSTVGAADVSIVAYEIKEPN